MVRNVLIVKSVFLALVLLAAGCAGGTAQTQNDAAPTSSAPAAGLTAVVQSYPGPAATATSSAPAAGPTAVAQPYPGPATEAAPAQGDLITIVLMPEGSEARYRVREQLVGVSLPNDAVGATRAITGKLVARPDGTIIAQQSGFQVDLSTLRSDEGRRDNFVRRNILQTDRFPLAVFVPTEVRGLSLPLPASGQVQFQLVGDLTIRDVSQQVIWEVTATIDGDEAVGEARTSFTFATFNLTKPRVPVVLSVEDEIRLEVDFHVRRET